MEKGKSPTAQLLAGYVSALGAMINMAISASCVQALRGAVPDFQLSVARSVVQLTLYVICGTLVRADFRIKRVTIPGLLCLGAAYMAVNIGSFGASTYLPLSEVSGIVMIGAMVTAFLHCRLFYNVDITKSNIIASLVCTFGIILAIQPPSLFKQMTYYCPMGSSCFENVSKMVQPLNDSDCCIESVSQTKTSIGYLMSTIGSIGSGVIFGISGMMLDTVKPVVKASYAAVLCIIGSVALMFYLEDPVLILNISQIMLLLGHAVSSTLSSFLVIQSAHYAPGPSLAVVYSLELVIMLICQYTFMHSVMPGNYNWMEVVGCMLIVFGASIPATLDILAHRAKADELP